MGTIIFMGAITVIVIAIAFFVTRDEKQPLQQ
jgi:hypothetical protein